MTYKCDEFAVLFGKWQRAKTTKAKWKVKITKHTAACETCQLRINHNLTLAELRGKKYTKKTKNRN